MEKWNGKSIIKEMLVDIVGGFLYAAGIYNFALNAGFPVAGFSGISIILHHLFGIPVGTGVLLLNIPVAIFCYRFLGKSFFFRSIKTMVIASFMMDTVAPLLPIYNGEPLLAALCMGVLCGTGMSMVYMQGSSTGGQDFVTMSIRKVKPHMTVGKISLCLDMAVLLAGTLLVFKEVDGLLYGIIVSYVMATVMDRIMLGSTEGNLTLIVTERGKEVVQQIADSIDRGATIIDAIGGYSFTHKEIVLCACNKKELYRLKRQVHDLDPKAFTMVLKSNEVVGEGFQERG